MRIRTRKRLPDSIGEISYARQYCLAWQVFGDVSKNDRFLRHIFSTCGVLHHSRSRTVYTA